jgi:hypothetical protein
MHWSSIRSKSALAHRRRTDRLFETKRRDLRQHRLHRLRRCCLFSDPRKNVLIGLRPMTAGSTDDADGTDAIFSIRAHPNHSRPGAAFTRERDLDAQAFGVVHDQAFPGQQHVQAAVAEPTALRGELPQPYPDRLIVGSPGSLADRRAVRSNHRTRPPLAHLERGTQVTDDLALGDGRHHFLWRSP